MNRNAATLLLVSVMAIVPASAIAEEAAACWRSSFPQDSRPNWISSAVALNGGLFFVDPVKRELLAFSMGDQALRQVSLAGWPSSFTRPSPLSITAMGAQFLLKSGGPDGVLLSNDLLPQQSFKLWSEPGASLYPGWIAHRDLVLGYGSVVDGGTDLSSRLEVGRGFQLGFILANVDRKAGKLVKQTLLSKSEENDYYRIGYQYFAANIQGLYFLDLSSGSVVLKRVDEASRRAVSLKIQEGALPAKFLRPPSLSTPGRETLVDVYRAFERATAVAGLYGSGDRLYILTREQQGGRVEWRVFVLDGQHKLVGSVQLPSSAEHLTVVASDKKWYLIERGAVIDWGNQEIASILEVPKVWIDIPENSPLGATAQNRPVCERRTASKH